MPKFIFILLLIALYSCNTNKGKKKTSNIWPISNHSKVDTSLVITSIPDDYIETFPFVPTLENQLVKHEPQYKDCELGKSVNSATKNVQLNLVLYNFTKEEINTKFLGHVDYDFKSVKDIYDLVKKFNLDASLAFKYFSFKGSARYELSKSLNINKYHEYIAARVYDEDREESLKQVFIRPEAAKVARSNKALFVSKYGDEVITSKVIGGDLIVLLEIESNSSKEIEKNKTQVDLAFKAWGASGQASLKLENALTEVCSVSRVKIKVIHNGVIEDDSVKYSKIGSLKLLIDNFPQMIHKQGIVLEYKLSSIFHSIQDLPENVNALDFLQIEKQKYQLNTMDNNMNALISTLPDLEYVKENSQMFTKNSFESAKKIYNLNYQAYRIYDYNWRLCASDPTLCEKCKQFKFHPTEFIPTYDSSLIAKEPLKKNTPFVVSADFKVIATIPAKTAASVNFEGKIQYNHIGPWGWGVRQNSLFKKKGYTFVNQQKVQEV